MNRFLLVFGAACLVTVSTLMLISGAESSAESAPSQLTETIPGSLERLYPPLSSAPDYLIAMHLLSRSFAGIVSDVAESDLDHARSNFADFEISYQKVADMVPEWKTRYPMAPLENLKVALATNDPAAIMPAIGDIGAVCHTCHLTSMVPVQQLLRWDRFEDVVVEDPLSQQDVTFGKLMQMLETNFAGIANDLKQGQIELARKHLDGFEARFQAMSEACAVCHDTERHYYVSDDITDLISGLRVTLSGPECDMKKVGEVLQTIGQESCAKCHMVHLPAAYAQQAMTAH